MPVVLTIAGSDCSGGAGIQADLKTFASLGVHGTSAVTCVVAEHPGLVLHVAPLAPARVAEQIRAVLEAFPVAAIKTGMLGSHAIIGAVEKALDLPLAAGVPLVVDPVMTASAGGRLLEARALPALRRLMKRASLVTPNLQEVEWLNGSLVTDAEALRQAGIDLAREFAGPHVLVKGGHLKAGAAVDWLVAPTGQVTRFASRRFPGVDPHGTGCTLSAAITAGLAKGAAMPAAVAVAKRYITRAIERHLTVGGYPLLNHLSDD